MAGGRRRAPSPALSAAAARALSESDASVCPSVCPICLAEHPHKAAVQNCWEHLTGEGEQEQAVPSSLAPHSERTRLCLLVGVEVVWNLSPAGKGLTGLNPKAQILPALSLLSGRNHCSTPHQCFACRFCGCCVITPRSGWDTVCGAAHHASRLPQQPAGFSYWLILQAIQSLLKNTVRLGNERTAPAIQEKSFRPYSNLSGYPHVTSCLNSTLIPAAQLCSASAALHGGCYGEGARSPGRCSEAQAPCTLRRGVYPRYPCPPSLGTEEAIQRSPRRG